jgi:predicted kinase
MVWLALVSSLLVFDLVAALHRVRGGLTTSCFLKPPLWASSTAMRQTPRNPSLGSSAYRRPESQGRLKGIRETVHHGARRRDRAAPGEPPTGPASLPKRQKTVFNWDGPPDTSLEYFNPRTTQQALLLLVGLPGSGKTSFAQTLLEETGEKPIHWIHVNQDLLKTRVACESLCTRALQNGWSPIIDRCNFNGQQRDHFLQIGREANEAWRKFGASIPIHAIVFHVPIDECIRRIQHRQNHPTLKGPEAPRVVGGMARDWQAPSAAHEGLDALWHVHNQQDMDRILEFYIKEFPKKESRSDRCTR